MIDFEAWTSPDLSITITRDEALQALHVFSHVDWDEIEAMLPEGAKDTTGAPLDRHNRYLRIAAIGEALTQARNAAMGAGLDLLSNPFFDYACQALLDSYDRARRNLS